MNARIARRSLLTPDPFTDVLTIIAEEIGGTYVHRGPALS